MRHLFKSYIKKALSKISELSYDIDEWKGGEDTGEGIQF